MGVPTTRTPVRVARGTYSNLSTTNALAALAEGEIAFATDEGKLYVKQGAGLTGISASSQAAPTPSDVTASPAFASGAGTSADPFVITNAASPFAGGTINSAQQITIANGTPGDLVVFTDNSSPASDRFKGQEVGTVNSAGNYTFNLNYTDTPNTTTDNTTYVGSLQVGSVHFQWTVVQSALAPLSQATATTIATSGLAVGNTITATAGTAAGGTSPYTYAVRWERSFNGTSGWFDTGYTGLTYTIVQADSGYYVRAVATATDSTAGASGGPLTFDLPSVATSQININSLADITNVVLAEDDATGARFTSKNFSADATMNPEGVPTSTKAVKVKFSGTFTDYPSTDNVTTVLDNDPADIAYAAAGTSLVRLDASNQYYSSDSAGIQSAFSYDSSDLGVLVNGVRNRIYYRRGASSAYASSYGFSVFKYWTGWDGPVFPTDGGYGQGSEAQVECEFYYKSADTGDTTQYRFYHDYGTTSGSGTSYNYMRAYAVDSNNEILGFFIQNNDSSYDTRLHFCNPFTGSSNRAYELQNVPSTYTNHKQRFFSLGNVVAVPSHRIQKGVSGYFRFFTITSIDNADWSSSYTDVAFDDIISSTDANLTEINGTGYSSELIADSTGDTEGAYHAFLYWVRNTEVSSRYDQLVLWIDKSDDPTVASNWNSRFIPNLVSINSGNNTYIDGSGRIALMRNGSTTTYCHISTDFGATWTSTPNSRTPTRTNITSISDDMYSPYYVDGHWFFYTQAQNSGNWGILIRASNNNGASWFDVAFALPPNSNVGEPKRTSGRWNDVSSYGSNFFNNVNGRLLIHGEMDSSRNQFSVWYLNYNTILTLASTQNLTGLDIQVGDTLRQGSVTGVVTTISGSTVTLGNVNGVFNTGSPVQNTINHSGGSAGTVYAIVGGSGAVSDLQTADPGFVDLGSNPNITISLPATFPTGNTPDVELPSGTTLQVTVKATNSSGSDTLDSNIITPS